jgi:cell division protein FtsZ
MEKFADSMVLIPNEKLRIVMGPKTTLANAFKAANDVLQNAVQGISDVITRPGQINLDFADVKTVMANRGKAMMGMGSAKGEDRAMRAVEAALSSPLLDDLELSNARGILLSMSCDRSLKMGEMRKINERVQQIAHEDADFKFGTSLDSSLDGEMRVTVVATGLGGKVPHNVVSISSAPTRSKGPVNLDEPAINRMRGKHMPDALKELVMDETLLDIPAFLRAQAD